MTRKLTAALAALLGLVFAFTPLTAMAADPAIKCETSKLKQSGKYSVCRLKAEAKGVQKNLPPDYTKCESKFTEKFNKAETKAGPTICPSELDEASMNARITTDAAEIATLLAGGEVSNCGNGTVEAGEDCDFGDLNGKTCTTQGLFGDGLACTPVTCVFDTSGCSLTRYEDTGLGTVIDHQTGLEWQKTDDDGGLTDKDNVYSWTAGTTEANGTAFGVFLEGLNGGTASSGAGPTTAGYAGHNDWRMPRIEELTTILLEPFPCGTNPCIDQSVFGVTNASSFYWSSSTFDNSPGSAWFVVLFDGGASLIGKGVDFRVRAVRGGS